MSLNIPKLLELVFDTKCIPRQEILRYTNIEKIILLLLFFIANKCSKNKIYLHDKALYKIIHWRVYKIQPNVSHDLQIFAPNL